MVKFFLSLGFDTLCSNSFRDKVAAGERRILNMGENQRILFN